MSQASLLTEVVYPFAYGALTTTGAQYGGTISTAGSTAYVDIEEVTVAMPTQCQIVELEVGLTMGLTLTVTTDSPKVSYTIGNSSETSHDTLALYTSTKLASLVSTTTFVDFTCAGRFTTPSDGTYFTGNGPFTITAMAAANATTSKVQGAMKNTSYVRYKYYLR